MKNFILISIFLIIIIIFGFHFLWCSEYGLPPCIFGYRFFIVQGSSMEPTLYAGNILLVVQTECQELKENDIIVFKCERSEYGTTVHRIIDIKYQESEIILLETQGDNVCVPDPKFLNACDIVGKVKYVIKI